MGPFAAELARLCRSLRAGETMITVNHVRAGSVTRGRPIVILNHEKEAAMLPNPAAAREPRTSFKGVMPAEIKPDWLAEAIAKAGGVNQLTRDGGWGEQVGRPHEPDKGRFGGTCNREACQAPWARWYNVGSSGAVKKFYCGRCAALINTGTIKHDGIIICELVKSADDPITNRPFSEAPHAMPDGRPLRHEAMSAALAEARAAGELIREGCDMKFARFIVATPQGGHEDVL